MAAFSNYLEGKILDHVLRNTAYTSPGTSVYVALYTTDPTDAKSGTEVSGGSYARVQVTAWDAVHATNGNTQNTSDITFPTASASWGTVTHFGILDASTAGNLLFHGVLTASKAVASGDTFKFSAGNLVITLA